MDLPTPHVNLIIDGLWLGDEISAQDVEFAKSANIQAIVNATKDVPCKFMGVEYLQVPVDDPGPGVKLCQVDNQDMLRMFPEILQFIRRNMIQKKNILVHCHAGAQRSAIIVLLYLMLYVFDGPKDERFRLAFLHMIKQRPLVFYWGYSINFKPALVEYLRDLD